MLRFINGKFVQVETPNTYSRQPNGSFIIEVAPVEIIKFKIGGQVQSFEKQKVTDRAINKDGSARGTWKGRSVFTKNITTHTWTVLQR